MVMFDCTLLVLTKAIYSIFKTESEQVDDLRMVINVSFIIHHTCSVLTIDVFVIIIMHYIVTCKSIMTIILM